MGKGVVGGYKLWIERAVPPLLLERSPSHLMWSSQCRVNFYKRFYRWYVPERPRYTNWNYLLMVLGGSSAAYGIAMVVDTERAKSQNQGRLTNGGMMTRYNPNSNDLVNWWKSRRESERTIFSLIALNSLVFIAWKVPSCHNFLSRYFMHSIRAHPITMLTSTFSHMTGMHLLFNMLALYSFGRMLHEKMGREQFLAFYLSAGLAASAGSHIVRSLRADLTKSLGASGAVFGVAAGCAHQPNVRVSLIFVPFVSVPINVALPVMMIYDTIGLLGRWKTFDHAAHLSGATFGYLLYAVSTRHLWPKRYKILGALGYPLK